MRFRKTLKLVVALTMVAATLLAGQAVSIAVPDATGVVIDDFEDGDASDWGFFGGNAAGGGGGALSDRPYEGGFYFSTGWGGEGTTSGFYGGAFKNYPDAAQVTPPAADPWFNVWVLNQSDATVDTYTLEITIREDLDGNGWTDGAEDSFRLDTTFPSSTFDDEWRLVSAPLSAFTDLFTGGDGTFDGNLDEVVIVIAGVQGGSGSTVELDMDLFAFSSAGPLAFDEVLFDDMEHGDPSANGWFAFNGSVGGGGIGPNAVDLPPADGGAFSLETGWGSGGTPGFYGGFGRTNPIDVSGTDHFNFWINPDAGQDYTLEINLQDDDSSDGAISSPEDDEFQFNCVVSAAGPCAVAGGGWQLVSIPLDDFVDDNSFLTGGNGVLDPTTPARGGNGELINMVIAVIGNGSDVNFRTDYWIFTRGPLVPDTRIVIDDFESGVAPGTPCAPAVPPLNFCTFSGAGSSVVLANPATPPAPVLPAVGTPNSVLQMDVDVTSFAGFIHGFEAGGEWVSQDWSTSEGFSLWFHGAGTGSVVFIDILDNRNPGSTTDDAERWTVDFVDDFTGWQLLEFPFASFSRKEIGNGAPNDGFGLFEVHGWALGTLDTGGPQTYYVDEVSRFGVAAPPALAVSFATANNPIEEGATGDITVKLNRPFGPGDPAEVSVDFATVQETSIATPGDEYTPTSGTLTFTDGGPTELTFPITTFDDTKFEGDERIALRLSNPVDVELPGTSASAFIVDDDPFDPNLLDDFEQGAFVWESAGSVELDATRVEAGDPDERPGQDAIENVLTASVPLSSEIPDKNDNVGLVDGDTGEWYLRQSDGSFTRIVYGDPHDQPFMGDWNCDGVDTPGLYRPVNNGAGLAGKVYLRNSNTTGNANVEYFYGDPGDFAVVGDWDGDGCDTVSIYRPSTSEFHIKNSLGSGGAGIGRADVVVRFGDPGFQAFAGDFDDDGTDGVGVRNPASGQVSIRNTATNGAPDGVFFYGNPGDVPISGDWDGNPTETVGVFRPSEGKFYLRNTNTAGAGDTSFFFGEPDWIPVSWGVDAGPDASFGRDFAIGQDWTGTESLSFWYHGAGGGEDVVVTLKDNAAPDPGPSGWSLVWSDEFEEPAGSPPNPENWTHEIGDVTPDGKNGWGNEELQYYTDDPANAATDGDGNLVITLQEADGSLECYYGPCEYTSARLLSWYKAEFAYGRIESRLRVPDAGADGRGLWPAFWSLGTDINRNPWPGAGEIDIMEWVGRLPNEIFGTIHGPGYSGGGSFGGIYDFGEPVFNDFHTFTVEWEPDLITWYVDGIQYHQATPADVPGPWVFDKPFFLLLNFAIGGNFGGPVGDDVQFPQEYLVDYVRVFQGPDTAERFEATFTDDVAGWRHVTVPISAFTRSADQPAGAPDDGLSLDDVHGYGFTLPDGNASGEVKVDFVELIPVPPPAELTVTTLDDGGAGSLREALGLIADGGTITFDPALAGQTIGLTTGQLVVDRSVTIDASTAPGVVISGGNASRVFQIEATATVSMNDLEIADGAAAPQGGGVLNFGTLNLDRVVVRDNAETSPGPANFEFGGGGIYNGAGATLNLTDSTVADNTSLNQPSGGIYGFFGSTINITRSTVSGNAALADVAGGLRSLGDATIVNSTFSGNVSTAWHGGGIFHTDGQLTVTNSTFSGNVAPGGTASGILVATFGAPANATLTNNVLEGSGAAPACAIEGGGAATITSNGFNVISDGSCAPIGTDQSFTDALLGPLADYGGPTLTHALGAGSPALDAADAGACPATDQRGVARPQGPGCDAGAFELVP